MNMWGSITEWNIESDVTWGFQSDVDVVVCIIRKDFIINILHVIYYAMKYQIVSW